MKRISEGHFDDVQKVNKLPSKTPREMKELTKKGLGELYVDEYAQKTGLVSQALSFSDEQKKESVASINQPAWKELLTYESYKREDMVTIQAGEKAASCISDVS
ncbi:uncharacterized protein LOC110874977 [Helianthus annuus]|uniref:uncharacterized protein LOC110874977 n=1 Tax=Helianthus annuus TaxID=4232 RepID=UPI000B8FFF71|nr:uncharacterized protein LOC110874977 [Helianthus annuus]